MHRIPHGIQDAVQGRGPSLNPARSSCSLRDNGSHVELETSYEVPGTAHGIPHGIPHPVLKSTRNSGSRTQQDPALKSAWNSRSLRGHGPRVRYMHVTLNPARGPRGPARYPVSRITYGSRADIEAWGIIDRTVGQHLQLRVGLGILRHASDPALNPTWNSGARTSSGTPHGSPLGHPGPVRHPGHRMESRVDVRIPSGIPDPGLCNRK